MATWTPSRLGDGGNDDRNPRPRPLSSDVHDLYTHAAIAFQQLEQLPGDRPLQAAADLADALALAASPGGVGASLRVVAQPGQQILCSARLSWRSPPRFSRCLMTCPDDAGMGLAPASAAKAASERSRPVCDQLTSTWAALIGPTPGSSSSHGRDRGHQPLQLGPQLGGLGGQQLDAPGGRAQRPDGHAVF
jgi:hypothetical protein